MVTTQSHRPARAGVLAIDLAVALGILVLTIAPITLSWMKEQRLVRNQYYRAIAMQIVDGEMEIIAAGKPESIPPGRNEYKVTAAAAKNLPPGEFSLLRQGRLLRLAWIPASRQFGRPVVREVTLP